MRIKILLPALLYCAIFIQTAAAQSFTGFDLTPVTVPIQTATQATLWS